MTPNTPRPNRSDPVIIAEAAKKLAPRILAWANEGTADGGWTIENIELDLGRAIRFESDGFQLAKELDSRGYEGDEELVEILSGAFWAKDAAHKAALKAWLPNSGLVEPALESRVTHKSCVGVGVVTRNSDDGTSVVCFPDMGHVRAGNGTQGRVLPWEELESAPSPVAP